MKSKSTTSVRQMLCGMYCAALVIQNVLATKTVDVFMFTVTTGVLMSPLVFILQDVSSELYGYEKTKGMVLLSFAMNFVAVLMFQLAIMLPPSLSFNNQTAFASTLGSTLRITCASFAAYLAGSLINSKVMVALKKKNKKHLFVRAITSTIAGQFCDNAIFSFFAFAFVLPVPVIWSMVFGATLFEVLYEVLFYPITKQTIRLVSAIESKEEE